MVDGSKVDFAVTRDQAIELRSNLYQNISLKGKAKLNIHSNFIQSFKLYDIVPFVNHNIKKAFSELRNITSGFWDKYNTSEEIQNYLRGDA